MLYLHKECGIFLPHSLFQYKQSVDITSSWGY